MARKDGIGGAEGDRTIPIDAMNGTVKLALGGAQTNVSRYGDIVSEVHRRFAVLMWRGTLPLHSGGDGNAALIAAQRAINTTLAQAAALAETGTRLQLKILTILRDGGSSENDAD